MLGYTYQTEQEAINARQECADYKGLPVPNGTSIYWVDYSYSQSDNFYYIIYDEGVEVLLGEPITFEIITEEIL